jgi:hypothetical protein
MMCPYCGKCSPQFPDRVADLRKPRTVADIKALLEPLVDGMPVRILHEPLTQKVGMQDPVVQAIPCCGIVDFFQGRPVYGHPITELIIE